MADAHALYLKLRRVHDIQFGFAAASPPPIFAPPKWLLQLLKALAPALPMILVGALILAVLVIAWLAIGDVIAGRRRRSRRATAPEAPLDLAPPAAEARALLEDADRLAAEGRFDEAARLILKRSVEDIDARRPRLVRPALTAREIAQLPEAPPPARTCFAAMAALVEQSAFAGRRLSAAQFAACREAYARFASPQAWAG